MNNIGTNDFLETIVAPPKAESIIMVLGVGGAGGNAVNHMFDLGIKDVTFMVCNTDRQALDNSPIENKIQLGEGLGAGNDPAKGRKAAIETLDEIMLHLENCGTKMLFVTAGMGGGTGTGAAPVIAKAAKEKGILTVGIVTLPFRTEGRQRMEQAAAGLEEMNKNTDSIVVIHNDNITKIYGSLPFEDALHKVDDVLATAAKGIAELITRAGIVNVDFADVRTVMTGSGMALMGSARASGDDKIEKVVEEALSSPLLNHQDIRGAKNILFNLSYNPGHTLTFDEATRALDLIQKRASKNIHGNEANIIWGAGETEVAGGDIELTIVATGFDAIDRVEQRQLNDQRAPIIDEQSGSSMIWRIKDRYKDIDTKLIEPAFFRRGLQLQLLGGSAAAKTAVKTDMAAQEGEKADTKPTEGTLF